MGKNREKSNLLNCIGSIDGNIFVSSALATLDLEISTTKVAFRSSLQLLDANGIFTIIDVGDLERNVGAVFRNSSFRENLKHDKLKIPKSRFVRKQIYLFGYNGTKLGVQTHSRELYYQP